MVGILSQKEALEQAYKAGLDLVEISPNADPPVCKILDYGKYKFEEQKRRAEIRKKQKIIEIKDQQKASLKWLTKKNSKQQQL